MSLIKVSKDIYARILSFNEITPTDIFWLDKATERDYHETGVEDILDGLQSGVFQVWRIGEREGSSGIAVSTILEYPRGRELICTYIAGRGFLSRVGEFLACMENYGRVHNCRWFSVLAAREGLEPIYTKLGNKLGTVFIKEI